MAPHNNASAPSFGSAEAARYSARNRDVALASVHREPAREIEVCGGAGREVRWGGRGRGRGAAEEVWDDGKEAVEGEAVREKLCMPRRE